MSCQKRCDISKVTKIPSPGGNVKNLGVGNAVPGVPSGAVRQYRARRRYRIAVFGGWNAEDGVPYGRVS